MAYYSATILICLCSYFIIWNIVGSGGNDATDGYKGNYGHRPDHYEVVVPFKVDENGNFVSHVIPHHYQRSYYETRRKRDMGIYDRVNYVLPIAGEEHHLQLYPNNEIMSPGMVVEIHDDKGISDREIHKLGNVQCHYTGSIKGQEDSRVALSTCYGLTGYVRTRRGLFFIEPASGHNPLEETHQPHLLYQHETDPPIFQVNCDTIGNVANILSKRTCGEAATPEPPPRQLPLKPFMELYIETLIVLDKTILNYHKEIDIENYVLTVFNMAHDLYHDATLHTNINLAIVRMIRLEDEEHEMNLAINKNVKNSLQFFAEWQRQMNPSDDTHPNHHDVAVLLTRIDICGDDNNCGLLGASMLGGMCDPKHQAALCEDNGLRLGFVIAHEIAHTLAIPHDTPKESGCNATLPGGLTTVMNPSVDIRTAEWSKCSCKYLSLFIDQGLEGCLYDPPTDHSFTMPDILPGVMYGGDFQCRELLGPNAGLCNVGLECDNLICYVEDKGCIETHTAAAPGTSCGERKWCHRGQCLTIGERPLAVDGGWSKWSEWSTCSRSCGSGVSSRHRHCNNPSPAKGGEYCNGQHKAHKICNTEPCPLGKPSFRNMQCTEFNDWTYPEDNKIHTWKAYYMADENPCILFCVNDQGEVASLQPRVIDGTKCYTGMRDICVDGLCKEIPCDLDLESDAIEDWCGVCRGDGTSCKVIQGQKVVKENSDGSAVKLIDLPSLTVNIKIEEAEPSESQIQIKSEDGDTTYVVGDVLGMSDVPGSKAWVGNVRAKQQVVIVPGPISTCLTIWVTTVGNGVIKYSYGVKEEQKRCPNFAWDYVGWTRCSAICGPGTQEAIPKCIERVAGLVDDIHCRSIKQPKEQIRPCEVAPCIPRWFIGNWQPCECSTAKRLRIVKCVKPTGDGEGEVDIISDNECPGPKPKHEDTCGCAPSEQEERKTMLLKNKCGHSGGYEAISCRNYINGSNDNACNVTTTTELNGIILDKEDTKDLMLVAHKEEDDELNNYPTHKPTTVIYGKEALKYLNEMERDFSNNKSRV